SRPICLSLSNDPSTTEIYTLSLHDALPIFMEKITFNAMREFIIENELTDNVSITLHPDNFDELVLDYLDFNDNQIERPFEILGIEILQDNSGEIPKSKIHIMEIAQ